MHDISFPAGHKYFEMKILKIQKSRRMVHSRNASESHHERGTAACQVYTEYTGQKQTKTTICWSVKYFLPAFAIFSGADRTWQRWLHTKPAVRAKVGGCSWSETRVTLRSPDCPITLAPRLSASHWHSSVDLRSVLCLSSKAVNKPSRSFTVLTKFSIVSL